MAYSTIGDAVVTITDVGGKVIMRVPLIEFSMTLERDPSWPEIASGPYLPTRPSIPEWTFEGRAQDVTLFLGDDRPKLPEMMPDAWLCPYCGGERPMTEFNCGNCGAARTPKSHGR